MGVFGPGLLLDDRTGRPIAGRVLGVFEPGTDLPLQPVEVDGTQPITVATDSRGYYGQFEVPNLWAVLIVAGEAQEKVAAIDKDPILEAEVEAIAQEAVQANSIAYRDALGTTHLDSVIDSGVRVQTVSSNASTANGYPPGEYRGTLNTFKAPGQSIFLVQQYLGGFTKKLWQREYYSGSWSTWALIGPAPAYDDSALEGRVATLEAAESAVTVQPDAAVVYGSARPDAFIYDPSVSIFWHSPDGTEVVPATYKGDGYVGTLGQVSPYTTMQITKVQTTNEVEVSCLDPVGGRHVTHRVQGQWDGVLAGLDNQRRFEEAWVGTYTGTTVSKDLLIMPRSNVEWAFQITVGGNSQFAPYHGAGSTYAVQDDPAVVTDATGAAINLDALSVGGVLTGVQGFKVRQRLFLEHPDAPGVRWVRVDEVRTIHPDGLIQNEATITFLEDTTIGSNYGPMTPVDQATFGRMDILDGGQYAVLTSPPASTTYTTITEGHAATSALFTSTTRPAAFAAVAYLHPDATLMRGHALEDTTQFPLRLEQRSSSGLNKLYPGVFVPGSVVPAGTVWRPAAQWRYGETSNPVQYA